jgi:hypothetical protein
MLQDLFVEFEARDGGFNMPKESDPHEGKQWSIKSSMDPATTIFSYPSRRFENDMNSATTSFTASTVLPMILILAIQ